MLVVLGLSVLAFITTEAALDGSPADDVVVGSGTVRALCILMAIGSFLGSIVWTLGWRRSGTFYVFALAAVSLGLVLLPATSIQALGLPQAWLRLGSELSSSLMLGASTTGMLLGHWYLTAPTMSITPLSRLNAYFGAAGVIRLDLSSIGLVCAWDQLGGGNHMLWLWLRWTAGVVGPLLVVLMVWRILKLKNTQSATGVLFVGVILTFLGEMTAALLYEDLALPL